MAHIQGKPADQYDFRSIKYEKSDWKATITINRPEALNAIDLTAFQEISEALRDAEWDDHVAVVVLTGAGDRAFCSGADLKEHYELCTRPRDYFKWITEFIAMQTRLVRLGKPTIARLNGLVLGAGNELNLACDLAVAADHVIIRQAGTARGSVAAIGVTQWLPLVIGDRRAREILLLCEDISAEKALAWGLVNEVVSASELDAAIDRLASKLTHKFAESTRYTRTQTNFFKELVWGVTASHAADWLAIHSGSAETFEGMTAFIEKRDVAHMDFRERAMSDRSPEFAWGAPVVTCTSCGAKGLPAQLSFCGNCGAPLATARPADAAVAGRRGQR
jgi:enoyl-CoA hydratase/carnithine racemase